jgi:hypothetical protein
LRFLNDRGQILFDAFAVDPMASATASKGAWIYDPLSGLQLVVGEDLPAPSFANGFMVGALSETHLNNAGQVAILAFLEGVPSTDNRFNAWLHTPGSQPRFIAREGPRPAPAPA